MPDQRTFAADVRAVLVSGRGVPSWGAVLIAATFTLIGIAIEAGSSHSELGGVFATCYALGCIAAVLAVRQSGMFTAVVQPPLLLFVAVPLAYYLFHESAFGGLKDVLINCGYPLIERFPLMLFTTAATLLIGLVRRYLAMHSPGNEPAAAGRGALAGLSTKVASAVAGNGSVDEDAGTRPARPRHVVDRPVKAKRARKPQQSPTRARHSRLTADEVDNVPPRQRARRPAREADRAAEPRRRSREGDPRRTPPPPRHDPRERRDYREPIQPRAPRTGRMDPYEAGRGYPPNPQYGAYPPPPPYDPRRRGGPAPNRHPVSRVRYRDGGPPANPYDTPHDPGSEWSRNPRGR